MDEYRRYLERLKQIVSMEVVPKTAMFDYFTRHIYRIDQDPVKAEPLIWYIQSALLSDLTFSLHRLYDGAGQSGPGNRQCSLACPE